MGVEFQEENIPVPARHVAGVSGIVGFLIKKGIAKDTVQANMILLAVIGLALAGMIYFFASGNESKNAPEPIPDPIVNV